LVIVRDGVDDVMVAAAERADEALNGIGNVGGACQRGLQNE